MRATVGKLEPKDLSPQLGIYYRGKCPGGKLETLWQYSHCAATDGVNRWWFQDCMQRADAEPFLVPFSTAEVSECLRRV